MKKKPSVPEGREDFQKLSAELVHDIATPLASLQLNVQSLANYLPQLLACYEKSAIANDDACVIPPSQLSALAHLPEAIEGDVQKLRSLSKNFLLNIAGTEAAASTPWQRVSLGEFSQKALDGADPHGPTEQKAGPGIRPLKVLLVEDEAVHRDIVLRQLNGGFTVDCASTGQEALAKARTHDYDLVLLDFFLPGMDAPTLLDRLQPLLPARVHLIGFSNLPATSAHNGLYARVSACLDKPFRLENFLQLLQELPSVPLPAAEGNEK